MSQHADPNFRPNQLADIHRKQFAPSARNHRAERAGPAPVDEHSGLALLLNIEAEARRAETSAKLSLLVANETRKLTSARQIFVFKKTEALKVTAVSGLPKTDRNTPIIQEIEALVKQAAKSAAIGTPLLLEKEDYPFPYLLWQPLKSRKGHLIGGFLMAREKDWSEADQEISERLGETFGHAFEALSLSNRPSSFLHRITVKRKRLILGIVAALIAAMLFPIRMSVLAPMEVVADAPFIVAAPLDGVIADILVNPGDRVAPNDPLIKMGGIELQNKLDVAKQEVEVAEARLKKASQLAFGAGNDRNELRLAMADLKLKKAEFKFAQDMFGRSVIRAERAGVAVLSDKQSLIGKPVVTGERIMQIADPNQVKVRINLPISDALVLKAGAPVRVFLDSDPIRSREATIAYSDYQALPSNGNQLAFRVIANLEAPSQTSPRLGVRGTAQIYGDETVLGFYLFRRPLASFRQWIGL